MPRPSRILGRLPTILHIPMTDEQDRPDVDRGGRHRRIDDCQPVEVARLSNGARRNALIQTIAQIVSPIVIVLGLMWWAAKIDTGLAATREDIQDTRATVEAVRVEAQEAADDRRKLAEDQARTSEALSATAATVERVNVRLDMLMMQGPQGADE